MPNLVDNPKLLTSTSGDLQVMDSWGNFPTVYPGGAGVAPDNWWILGGPDYGTFLAAGGVWSTRSVGGGRSILLDAADQLVQNSGGITQVVPVLQESIKPIRFTASVAAEGCLGQPNVEVICIGYPPGYPGVGSADLFFDTVTYDFVQKRTTIVPTQKVKYLFFHLLHWGFTAGKAWYGGFSVEEIDMPQADIPTDNLTINPNFTYSPDGIVPTAWNTAKCTLVDELSPVGVTSLQMLQGGTLSQKDVIISRGTLKHEVTVHITAPAATELKITARLRGRYRTIISENSAIVQVGNSWTTRKITLLGTTSSEKMDVEVVLLSGSHCYIGTELPVQERHQAQATFLNIMRKQLHQRGKYLTCNQWAPRRFVANGNLVPDAELIVRPFDGHLLEVWCYESSFEPQDRPVNSFRLAPSVIKDEIDFIKWCGDNNQFVVALARSGPQCWEARMFSLAAFLMGKHAHAYYFHSGWNMINDQGAWLEPYGDLWHPLLLPEMVIRTGQPSGNYQLNNWLFSREFANCVALLTSTPIPT